MASQAKRQGAPPDNRTGKGPRIGNLDSLTGILGEMGCVYREMRRGQLPTAEGSKLIFALRCMRDVLETLMIEKLETKLITLEKRVEGTSYGDEGNTGQTIQPH